MKIGRADRTPSEAAKGEPESNHWESLVLHPLLPEDDLDRLAVGDEFPFAVILAFVVHSQSNRAQLFPTLTMNDNNPAPSATFGRLSREGSPLVIHWWSNSRGPREF